MQEAQIKRPLHEGLISALAFGAFLIIFAAAFGLMPGVPKAAENFFSDMTGVSWPVTNGNIVLPAPAHPAQHLVLFNAVFYFMVGIAVLQIVILVLRLTFHSRFGKISETVGNLIFWSGGAIVANVYLLTGTQLGWFQFWIWLLIILGISLIGRAFLHFGRRNR